MNLARRIILMLLALNIASCQCPAMLPFWNRPSTTSIRPSISPAQRKRIEAEIEAVKLEKLINNAGQAVFGLMAASAGALFVLGLHSLYAHGIPLENSSLGNQKVPNYEPVYYTVGGAVATGVAAYHLKELHEQHSEITKRMTSLKKSLSQ